MTIIKADIVMFGFLLVLAISSLTCVQAFVVRPTNTIRTSTCVTAPPSRLLRSIRSSSHHQLFAPQTSATTAITQLRLTDIPMSSTPSAPQEQQQNVIVKVWLVLKKTLTEFTTGYMGGYFISALWGIIKGGMIDPARCARWGMMFAPISAIYGGCDAVAKLFFGLTEQSLWNAVIKSSVTGIYLGRMGGVVGMIKGGALYGTMTYFLTKQRANQQIEQAAAAAAADIMNDKRPSALNQGPAPALDVDFEVIQDKDIDA